MIAYVRGTLVAKEIDRVEIMTPGGVGYELAIPLSAFETLPAVGEEASLHTHVVVREDDWQLFGFASLFEKRIFRRLLTANGVGPALALGMLSTLSADRLVRAIREKDIPTLQGVPRVGRKKAERVILDLADKLDDVQVDSNGATRPRADASGAEDAVRALISLGYGASGAEKAVRAAIASGARGSQTAELIRIALAKAGSRE